MTSAHAMRICMQVLVFLNLVFVQMTGAAGWHWLAPLFALTLATPLLERWRERRAYFLVWNTGVVIFFLVLANHAMRFELAYIRESGLVLAALCQVHLLNNLRSNQKPDLLFFNAFLIALITGFMTGYLKRDVGFPAAFLVFAGAYVVGLQLVNATRGGHVLSQAATRRLVVDGVRRAGVVLVVSTLVFLFWPRDFERKAFFHGKSYMAGDGPVLLDLGFNEELLLRRVESVGSSARPALRVTLLEGDTGGVPSLWRGATLSTTTGDAWRPMETSVRREAGSADEPWRGRWGRLTRPLAKPRGARVAVVRFAQDTERLFAPLGTRELELDRSARSGQIVLGRPDGTVNAGGAGDVRYELVLAGPPSVERGGAPAEELPPALAPYVQLPEHASVEEARQLATSLAAELPGDAEQHLLVAQIERHLVRNYAYLPPGSDGAAESLDEFLRGEAGGHCEVFASALATMLRTLEIPCRVVTGYRSSRWDAAGRVLSFSTRDAHAWVEVFDPKAGWYGVDPSPILVESSGGTGLWAQLRSRATAAWERVTGFDAERRAALFAWFGSLPLRAWEASLRRPLVASAALLLSTSLAAWLVRLRCARIDPVVRAYRRSVRRARLTALPGETPRELLRRARAEGLAREHVEALASATAAHEAARYAA